MDDNIELDRVLTSGVEPRPLFDCRNNLGNGKKRHGDLRSQKPWWHHAREMHTSDTRARWLARNVLPHEPALRSWLSRRPVIGLEIDDIVQDTYARLSCAANVEGVRNPRGYMFRTAFSIIADHLRRSNVVEMQSFAQFENLDFIDDEPNPERIVNDREELFRLGEGIARLPQGERDVLMLRRIDELTQRQVAERLGISESSVEKRMGRAIRRLADALGRGRKRDPRPSDKYQERNTARNAARDIPGD